MKQLLKIITLSLMFGVGFDAFGAGTSDTTFKIGVGSGVDVDTKMGDGVIRYDDGSQQFQIANDGVTFKQVANVDNLGNTPNLSENMGVDTSIGASALTIDLVQADGSTDATVGDSIRVSFMSETLINGGYSIRSVTAALTIVVPSGATLGHKDATDDPIYVYLLDNSGTVELAVSKSQNFNESDRQSTTVLDASSDSGLVIYSTVARTDVPIRLIGRLVSNQATAGTYNTSILEESILSSDSVDNAVIASEVGFGSRLVMYQVHVQTHTGTPIVIKERGDWVTSVTDNGLGNFSLVLDTSVVGSGDAIQCHVNSVDNGSTFSSLVNATHFTTTGPSSVQIRQWISSTGANTDFDGTNTGEGSIITCYGTR